MSGEGAAVRRLTKYTCLHTEGIAVYSQATGQGVHFEGPIEGANNGLLHSICGTGPIHVRQNGQTGSFGTVPVRDPIGAVQMPIVTVGALGGATNLPAPDFSPGLGSLGSSLYKVGQSVDFVDWEGSFASVLTDGTFFWVINESSATGFGFNIVDRTVGGSVSAPYPYQYSGYLGGFWGLANGNVPRVWHCVPSVQSGCFNQGSRVIALNSDSPTMVYQAISTQGGGSKIHRSRGDFMMYKQSDLSLVAMWGGARVGWNQSNVQIIGSSGKPVVEDPDVVVAGAALTCDFSGGSLYRWLMTRPTGVPCIAVVNNWHMTTGAY